MRFFALTLAFLWLATFASSATADMPGPREKCDADGLGCEECWQQYGDSSTEPTGFEACAGPLRAKGLTEACRHRQGAGDTVYFCPPGVKPEVRFSGCGCSAVGSAEGAGLVAFAAGIGVLWSRRKRKGGS